MVAIWEERGREGSTDRPGQLPYFLIFPTLIFGNLTTNHIFKAPNVWDYGASPARSALLPHCNAHAYIYQVYMFPLNLNRSHGG